jgi:hypothetical protein
VIEVPDLNITYEQNQRMADSSWQNYTTTYSVNYSGPFIAADLYAGDIIYPDAPVVSVFQGAIINETMYQDYFGQLLEVNRWNGTKVYSYQNFTESYEVCWIRSTGALAGYTTYSYMQNGTWIKQEVIPIAIISEFQPSAILPFVMIVALLTIFLHKYARKDSL